jgi:O-antigen ligase
VTGLVLKTVFVLIPFLAMAAPKGLAALFVAGGLLLPFDARIRAQWRRALPASWSIWALFGLLGVLSAFWSLDPWHSLDVAFRLLLLFGLFRVYGLAAETLDPESRRRLIPWLAGSGMVFLLLAVLAAGSHGPLAQISHQLAPKNLDDDKTRFHPGLAAFAVLFWIYAAAWAPLKGKWFAAAFAACSAAALLAGQSMAAPLAVAAGGCSAALAFGLGGKRGLFLAFGAVLAFLWALPPLLDFFYATDYAKEMLGRYMSWNVKHRLIIWQFALERLYEHPWLGWGLDGSRFLPGGNAGIPGVEGAEFMPLHPHNGFLQVWLELGVPGVLLLSACLVSQAKHLLARLSDGPLKFGAAVAASFAFLAQGLLSYGAWQSWWIALALLAVIFFQLLEEQKRAEP